MDKVLEWTVFLYNQKLEEDLGIELDEIEARSSIRVSSVDVVRELALKNDNEVHKDRALLELRTGDSFQVKGSYDNVLKRLKDNGWEQ